MIDTLTTLLNGLTNETKNITFTFKVDSEDRAASIVSNFKDEQNVGGYTLAKSGVTYKCKKDKEGVVIDEYWLVDVKMEFEVM